MKKQARVRSQLYAALARAFQKPEVASGEDEENALSSALERAALTLDAQALGPAVERLIRALEIKQGQAEQALRTLEIEYNRLFVGPGRPQAPPYESFYRSKWGLMMGPSTREVKQQYAEAGLTIAPDYRDLPDHVATELGFMAYLTMREAEAKGEKSSWLERERLFLQDHLSVWVPRLCQRVKEASQHPFYTALAELTQAFVSLDMEWSKNRYASQPEGAIG